jgi:hypothetical protein
MRFLKWRVVLLLICWLRRHPWVCFGLSGTNNTSEITNALTGYADAPDITVEFIEAADEGISPLGVKGRR